MHLVRTQPALIVPSSAIVTTLERKFVIKVSNNKTQWIDVRTSATLLTAAMIVGTGLYTSLGAATAKAGSGILIAMLIGGLIALSTGLSAAQVGVTYPEEGGAFIWTRHFGYPTLSFVAGCS